MVKMFRKSASKAKILVGMHARDLEFILVMNELSVRFIGCCLAIVGTAEKDAIDYDRTLH